jgi:tetratricopeptide (TPR) repeat protein
VLFFVVSIYKLHLLFNVKTLQSDFILLCSRYEGMGYMMTEIISLHSEDFYRKKASVLFEEAMRSVSENNHSVAKGLLEKAVSFDRSNAEYRFYAGVTNYILDDLESAEMFLKPLVEKEKFNVEYHYTYGIVLYRLKKVEEALSVFKEVVGAEPSHVDSLLYLGKILANVARHEEAIGVMEKAANIAPHRSDISFELGCGYLSLYKLDVAEDFFKKALLQNEKYAIAYYYLSKVYLKKGEHDNSIKVLTTLKNHCPEESKLVEKNIKVIEMLKSI